MNNLQNEIFTIALILAIVLVSYRGFKVRSFFERFKFHIGAILGRREYYRMLTSSFLHGDWMHLIFNCFSLYVFAVNIEADYGGLIVLLIFFLSVLGGDVLALLFYRHDYEYHAIGASGGVSGILYASIFLFPGGSIYMLPIPFPIPAWVYALFYTGITIYGIHKSRDNIGHEAHLGGALTGLLLIPFLDISKIGESPLLYGAVLTLGLGFLVYTFSPLLKSRAGFQLSGVRDLFTRKTGPTRSRVVNLRPENDIDRLLKKINSSGLDSLTPEEYEQFEEYSRSR